jgi:hypothetical protein
MPRASLATGSRAAGITAEGGLPKTGAGGGHEGVGARAGGGERSATVLKGSAVSRPTSFVEAVV